MADDRVTLAEDRAEQPAGRVDLSIEVGEDVALEWIHDWPSRSAR